MAQHAKRIYEDLGNFISKDKTLSERCTITEAETTALRDVHTCLTRGLPPPVASEDATEAAELEMRLYTYRLLIAAPWSARNAAPTHLFASALGKVFDQMTPLHVPDTKLRKPAALMCKWAERWLRILSMAYSGVLKGDPALSPPPSDEELESNDGAPPPLPKGAATPQRSTISLGGHSRRVFTGMRAIPPAHLFPSYADSQALIVLQGSTVVLTEAPLPL
jgi:hypothetical protein